MNASSKCPTAGVSNSFNAVGRIYKPGFYTGQTLFQKYFSWQDCISVVPKHFCLPAQETSLSNFAVHQPRHCLQITTLPATISGNRVMYTGNGANLKKKDNHLPRRNL